MSTDILDIWVNHVTDSRRPQFLGQSRTRTSPATSAVEASAGVGIDELLARMDELGVATGILTAGLDRHRREQALEVADAHPGRFLVAAMSSTRASRAATCAASASWPSTALHMVRVTPLFTQVPIDDARHYPVYQVCEELGIPVGINVGIPGPRVRSPCSTRSCSKTC